MYPDLVRAPRRQFAFHQRRQSADALDDLVTRLRRLSAPSHHRHFFAVRRVAADGAFDFSLGRHWHAPDQRLVAALECPCFQLPGEVLVGGVVLGHHHQPAGVLVESMHNAGPGNAADARQAVPAMGQQGIDQRSVHMPRRRMHYQALLFVDDDQVLIFINDVDGQRLGLGNGGPGLGHGNDICFSVPDLARQRRNRLAIPFHMAVTDQCLQAVSRHVLQGFGQKHIKAHPGLVLRDVQGVCGCLTHFKSFLFSKPEIAARRPTCNC